MIILGINEDHNATAAIVKDGKVLACISEERLSRVKNDTGYPYQAINEILRMTNLTPAQIDYVVFAGKYADPLGLQLKRSTRFKIPDYVREMHEYWKPVLIEKKTSDFYERMIESKDLSGANDTYYDYSFMKDSPKEKWSELMNQSKMKTVMKHLGIAQDRIRFIDHHTGHAYYGYYASPHDPSRRAAVVTADGWGDDCNATVSIYENGTIKEIHRTAMCNLARMYRWTTLLLGMKPNEHEYKVMGLAPYAKDYLRDPAYKIYKETLVVEGLDFRWNKKPSDMYFYFRDKFEGLRFDGIAAGLQMWMEELLAQWVTNIMQQTKTDTLYFSGGLSMNIKANKLLAELPFIKELYMSPSGGDESLAIGAAFVLAKELGDTPQALTNAYLGTVPDRAQALAAVADFRQDKVYQVIDEPTSSFIADLLSQGKVLGRCVGGMEFGARSLGNRAILCDPSKFEQLRSINEKIKFRDFWMPFTPSILKERANDYLVNPKGLLAEYMTLALDSTALAKEHLKAAIHPNDFTVRPQLVSPQTNEDYYQLIKAFEKKTGIGALLNTSLNLHGSPIACNAKDAIEVLVKSGLDGMILPGVLLLKKN